MRGTSVRAAGQFAHQLPERLAVRARLCKPGGAHLPGVGTVPGPMANAFPDRIGRGVHVPHILFGIQHAASAEGRRVHHGQPAQEILAGAERRALARGEDEAAFRLPEELGDPRPGEFAHHARRRVTRVHHVGVGPLGIVCEAAQQQEARRHFRGNEFVPLAGREAGDVGRVERAAAAHRTVPALVEEAVLVDEARLDAGRAQRVAFARAVGERDDARPRRVGAERRDVAGELGGEFGRLVFVAQLEQGHGSGVCPGECGERRAPADEVRVERGDDGRPGAQHGRQAAFENRTELRHDVHLSAPASLSLTSLRQLVFR